MIIGLNLSTHTQFIPLKDQHDHAEENLSKNSPLNMGHHAKMFLKC